MWSIPFSAALETKGRTPSPMRVKTATPIPICFHVFIRFFSSFMLFFVQGRHGRRLEHDFLSGMPSAARFSSLCLFFTQSYLRIFLPQAFFATTFSLSQCVSLWRKPCCWLHQPEKG